MSTRIVTNGRIEDLDFSKMEIGSQLLEINQGSLYDTHTSIMLTDIYRECLFVFRKLEISYNPNRMNNIDVKNDTYLRMDGNVIKVHSDMVEGINRDNFFLSMSGTVDEAINNGKLLGQIVTSNDDYVWYCAVPFKTIPNKYLVMETRVQLIHPHILVSHHFGILDPNHHFSITFAVDDPEQLFQFVRTKLLSAEYEKYRVKLLYPLLYGMRNFLDGVPPDNFLKLFKSEHIDKYFHPVFKHNDFEIYADYYKKELIHMYKGVELTNMSQEYVRVSEAIEDFYYKSYAQINPFTGEVIDDQYNEILFKDAGGLEVQKGRAFSYYIPIHDIYVRADDSEAQDIKDRKRIVEKLTQTP